MTGQAHIAGIYLYPIKSTAGVSVEEATVEPRGLAGDRRWVVSDACGEFLSGREAPELVKVRADPRADRLLMSAPGMPALECMVPGSGTPRQPIKVWNDHCEGLPMGSEADDWLSALLGFRCRLFYMDDGCVRPIRAVGGGEVSFADNYPLMLISSASLEDLNTHLPAPMDMRRFRPNLVADGSRAYAEDTWGRVRIGDAEFSAVDRCDRCAFTTIDPDSAEKHPNQEPLRTLSRYRRGADGGVYFGRHLIPERLGRIRIGDPVEIVA